MSETTDEQKTDITKEDKIFNEFIDGINLIANLFSEDSIIFRNKVVEIKANFSKHFEQIPKDEENEEAILQMEEMSSLVDNVIDNMQLSLEESVRILSGAFQISQKINPDNKIKENENS